MNVRTNLIGTIVLGAALLVPVAQAQQSPDDRAGVRGPGGIAALQADASNHPDNRSAARGPGAVPRHLGNDQEDALARYLRNNSNGAATAVASTGAATHPDNRVEPRGDGAFATTVAVNSTSSGFDWRDALIGGLGGIGTALLLTGFLLLLMSQRKKTRIA